MPQYSPDSLTGSTGTVHEYTIPFSGDWRIEAFGAQGGGDGGKGARCAGTFALTIGDKLFIGVGKRPPGVSGGGGASFIAVGATLATATPLLIAAGGGGCGNLPHNTNADGRAFGTAIDGQPGEGPLGSAGGTGGDGGDEASAASAPNAIGGSGGGWDTSGGRGRFNGSLVNDSGGVSIDAGATGGDSINGSALTGGFGGGGGGDEQGAGVGRACGGGGGYNGGGGGHWNTGSSTHRGGGGGSYNNGTNVVNESGVREGAGFVSVEPAVSPLPPANVTATINGHDVDITWDAPPGASPWDDDNDVVAEVERIDCTGTTHIATIQPGLSGSFTDRFAPMTRTNGNWCGQTDHVCSSTYRVRYHGMIASVEIPPVDPTIPENVLLLWDGTEASLPSGWSKETAADDKYLREIPNDSTDPGTTGGSATHSHTLGSHTHSLNHSHSQGNTPGNGSCTVPIANFTTPNDTRPCNHTHTRPDTSTATVSSGAATPSVGSATSEVSRKHLILAKSDGTPTGVPTGMMGWASGDILDDWEEDTTTDDARPPFIKGATGDGSPATVVEAAHTHTVGAHAHAGTSHSHSSGQTGLANSYSGSAQDFGAPYAAYAAWNHRHNISVSSATTAALNSGGGGNTNTGGATIASDPSWRRLPVQRYLGTDPAQAFPRTLIAAWLDDLVNIPAGWLLCDGSFGTPNLCQGRYPRYGGSLATPTGGGGSHTHGTSAHSHSTGSHSHSVSFGSSTINTSDSTSAPSGIGFLSRASTGHTHGSGSTNSTTPTVGSSTSGTTSGATIEPPYIETAFIMLVETGGSTETIDPFYTTSPWSSSLAVTIVNPEPALMWLRHPIDGEVVTCPTITWERFRPFSTAQAVEGGLPVVTTGMPGGRDYTLVIPCTDVVMRETVEDILAQNLFWCQPAGYPPVWLTVQEETGEALKVKGITVITAVCVEIDAEPVDDPEALL